jgi:hypothetical protein
MSEWLTTGQMIDRLKVGEVAECIAGDNKGAKVQYAKQRKGRYFLQVIDSRTNEKKIFVIKDYHQKSKWRILPKYVSFEEAMKAHQEGKTVFYHTADGKKIPVYKDFRFAKLRELAINDYPLLELVNGRWTIEEK